MKAQEFDVIIVGARAAGASLALDLARRGHRVLAVDKGRRGQDTLSTHFVWPRGASYLHELGVLGKVLASTPAGRFMNLTMDGIPLRGEIPLELLQNRFVRLHGRSSEKIQPLYFSARRKFIDTLLRDEAATAGADIEEMFTVEELIFDGGRVAGIRGRDASGKILTAKAPVVIGADGRQSTVAGLLNLPSIDPREACTFACYTYFTGASLGEEARIVKCGRLAMASTPTNDNAHMVLVYGPKNYFEEFRRDKEKNFFKALNLISPEIEARVREGKRVEPFYATADQAAFLRKASGPGYALIGDAACFKDQCTAIGMTHAFRDAVLLGEILSKALHKQASPDQASLDAALKDYEQKRYVDSARYYDFVCQQAEMNPIRGDERQIFEALSLSPTHTNRFLAMFGDTFPVRDFFTESHLKEVLKPLLKKPYQAVQFDPAFHRNPFLRQTNGLSEDEAFALTRNCTDFAQIPGPDLLRRAEEYHQWYSKRLMRDTFQYSRTLKAFPGPRAALVDDAGRSIDGINFASQDYLGLGGHPAVREAAVRALMDFGPHSAGSPMVIGNTTLSQKLERELAEMLKMEHVLLYPTGWAAGYGSIAGLVRSQDYVVMDRLTHSCLQQGTMAATKNVLRYPHLDAEAVRAYLRDIRSRDVRNGIMVITEGIFSMDADAPDLLKIQEVCHEYQATLLVDVAHDLGASGPGGSGQIGIQKLLGKIDLVMGSFSKSFASNGGFLATRSAAVKHYAKMYGSSHMFSNALSPVQSAVALEAARIIRSDEGEKLRRRLDTVVRFFRSELGSRGLKCLGLPGPIVPVMIGDERVSRVCHRLLQQRNLAAMILEFPVVAVGAARFRLQVMASHSEDEARCAAKTIGDVVEEATKYVERFDQGLVGENEKRAEYFTDQFTRRETEGAGSDRRQAIR